MFVGFCFCGYFVSEVLFELVRLFGVIVILGFVVYDGFGGCGLI